jgi:hypothetical protein
MVLSTTSHRLAAAIMTMKALDERAITPHKTLTREDRPKLKFPVGAFSHIDVSLPLIGSNSLQELDVLGACFIQ